MTSTIQFSDKIGDGILVVGGDNFEEFFQNLGDTLSPEIAKWVLGKFEEKYNTYMDPHSSAVSRVQSTLGGQEVQPQAAQVPPQCRHGNRIERRGTGKSGPYHGWVCPKSSKDPDRCEPIWL